MTSEDILRHTLQIAASASKDEFVAAFAAYVRDVVERETDPYEKIALFVYGVAGRYHDTIDELVKLRGGGHA